MNKECKSFQLFIGGINAKTTASPYTYSLDEFMRFCKLDDYAILASSIVLVILFARKFSKEFAK